MLGGIQGGGQKRLADKIIAHNKLLADRRAAFLFARCEMFPKEITIFDEFRRAQEKGERYFPSHPGCTIQEYVKAVDNFYATFSRGDRFKCRRESLGEGVLLSFDFDKIEIGRCAVTPLPAGGFQISETSIERGERRLIFSDIMDDLEWSIKVDLGLRPVGVRIKQRRQLSEIKPQKTNNPGGRPGKKSYNDTYQYMLENKCSMDEAWSYYRKNYEEEATVLFYGDSRKNFNKAMNYRKLKT